MGWGGWGVGGVCSGRMVGVGKVGGWGGGGGRWGWGCGARGVF